MSQFMFATGIENSYPTIQLPDGTTKRVDEMEKCGHYQRWKEDFALVKDMGIQHSALWPSPAHHAPRRGQIRLEFCRRHFQRAETDCVSLPS